MKKAKNNAIARFAVERRITLWMMVLGLVVLGALALQRLPLEFLPSFSSSSITASVSYPSSSPEEIERLIVRPLEDSLGTINGIETMTATADASSGWVTLTFVDGTDMELAAVEVRDRLDRVRPFLPEDVDRVWIRRFQSSDIPVLNFQLSSQHDREDLFEFAEQVMQRRLERLDGVAQVEIRGLQVPQIQVNLDPARLRAHRVSVRELTTRLRQDNRDTTLGDVREGSQEVLVRSIGELDSLEQLRDLPITAEGLRLRDVADVRYAYPRQEQFNFLNGVEALTLSIDKTSNSNLLQVVDALKEELEAIRTLPEAEGFEWRIYHDASEDVRQGLTQLRNAGLFGGGLAILAVFVFLRRLRTTLLVAIAIPLAVVATFVTMYFLRQAELSDITLNVVSLAGLMLALGMLVDNSIVVIESIFRHRNELGEDARTAALRGASEVALPIVASTATTLCVFVPVVFMTAGGWLNTYLRNIATTVCIVMVSSLLIALTVVPMLAVPLLSRQQKRPPGLIRKMRGGYGALLGWTLRHRAIFVVAMVILLWGAIRLFGGIEKAFSSRSEERQVEVRVDLPRQYSVEQTQELFEELYTLVDSRRDELGIADISYRFDRTTGKSGGGWRRGRSFDIYLEDEGQSGLTTAQVREQVRSLLPVRAGVELKIAQGRGRGSFSGVEIEIAGEENAVLARLADRLVGQLEQIPLLKDIDTSLASGDEEIHVKVRDDRILQAGLSSQTVALTVNNSLTSRPVSYFTTRDREVDVIVQYDEASRETLDQLRQVPVFAAGAPIPIDTFAEFGFVPGPSRIEREDHRPKIKVTANTADPRSTFAALGQVREVMQEFALPPGYTWTFGRWNRFQQQDLAFGGAALWFSLLLIYLLMAALFESLAQPLTIMLSVPFALLGVAVVLKLANQPLETMTQIGLIILAGVVVNNAIVLIDHINQLRADGMERTEAIILGGQHRLRPILITAVTTIVGLLPMVAPILFPAWFGPIEGRAGTWAPIGLVILGGLTTSTFLTLVITPTIYSLVEDLKDLWSQIVRWA